MTIAEIDIRWQMNGETVHAAFSLKAGVTALIGPSGAGKSTIARILCGLDCRGSGTISLSGKTLLSEAAFVPTQKRSIGLVMQDPALFPTMSVRENILIGCTLKSEQKLQEYLKVTDTKRLLDRTPTTLSGGEARRVAIARALAANPELLILDEPMNGLDPKRRRSMMGLIRQLAHQTQTPVLMITHQLEEMLFASDHALLVSHGTILEAGSVEDVLSAPDTARLLGIDDAGSIVNATVTGKEDHLLLTKVGEETLFIADDGEPIDSKLRLRILARDIALSPKKLDGISVLNQLPARIEEIAHTEKDALVTLVVNKGGPKLKSRITRKSCDAMALSAGDEIFALIKAVAVKELVSDTPVAPR